MIRRKILKIAFFLIPLVLVIVWYSKKDFIGGGEEGIPIYNALRTLKIYQFPWSEIGTGYVMPIYLPRITYLGFIYFIESVAGVQMAQAILFYFLMISGMGGVYLLVKNLCRDETTSRTAGIFYLLNLYSESQVWNRLLCFGIFAWAYLPLFLYLFLNWLEKRYWKWLVFFLSSSLIFSNSFGHPPFIFTLWIPAFIFVLSKIYSFKNNRKKIIHTIHGFIFVLLGWMIVNIWWIYPYIKLGSASFSEFTNLKINLGSLISVSQYFSTWQIVLLRQSFTFGKESLWYAFYSSPVIYLLSIIVFVIVLLGLIKSRKEKYWPHLISLLVVGWFISKGTNFPLGYIFYKFLFSNFPFMAVLRNPYEKFGIVWLLPYSIFFALGLMKIKNKLAKIGILFLVCGVLVWPMWTGDIYKNARVKVPDFYKQANDFLNQDKSSGRILMLPIIPGDGVRYSWGYQGVEPSEFLFDKASVSKMLRAKYLDDKYFDLYKKFISGGDYESNLREMNIKYLVLHHDFDVKFSGASSSAQVIETLNKNSQIKFLEKFGGLDIYEFKSENLDIFKTDGPEIEYTKLSPTKYEINVKNAQKSYTLIFKETFDKNWIIKIDGKVQENHSMVYDYANAWKIDKKGNYNVEVIFKVWPWE